MVSGVCLGIRESCLEFVWGFGKVVCSLSGVLPSKICMNLHPQQLLLKSQLRASELSKGVNNSSRWRRKQLLRRSPPTARKAKRRPWAGQGRRIGVTGMRHMPSQIPATDHD